MEINVRKMTKEEIESFVKSEDYVKLNVWLYTANDLLYISNLLMCQLEDVLAEKGMMVGGIKSKLEACKSTYESFYKCFGNKFFSKKTQRLIDEENINTLINIVEKHMEIGIDEGTRLLRFANLIDELGGGCDTCSKYHTVGCPASYNYDDGCKYSCYGYLKSKKSIK